MTPRQTDGRGCWARSGPPRPRPKAGSGRHRTEIRAVSPASVDVAEERASASQACHPALPSSMRQSFGNAGEPLAAFIVIRCPTHRALRALEPSGQRVELRGPFSTVYSAEVIHEQLPERRGSETCSRESCRRSRRRCHRREGAWLSPNCCDWPVEASSGRSVLALPVQHNRRRCSTSPGIERRCASLAQRCCLYLSGRREREQRGGTCGSRRRGVTSSYSVRHAGASLGWLDVRERLDSEERLSHPELLNCRHRAH